MEKLSVLIGLCQGVCWVSLVLVAYISISTIMRNRSISCAVWGHEWVEWVGPNRAGGIYEFHLRRCIKSGCWRQQYFDPEIVCWVEDLPPRPPMAKSFAEALDRKRQSGELISADAADCPRGVDNWDWEKH